MSREKSSAFEVVQKVGKSFFLPISLLPFTGVLLGVGASFTNPANLEKLGLASAFGEGTIINLILTIFTSLGAVTFSNLPLLFAMALALGLAKNEKAIAAFSSAIAFLAMNQVINVFLVRQGKLLADGSVAEGVPDGMITSVLGIKSLQMGVFGAIILGLMVVYLHNRFYKIELPSALSFFGGTRFVPIISIVCATLLGAFFAYTWPAIQFGIGKLGALVVGSGVFGTFLFGVIERALIPFGLHHVFYIPIWTTGLGGQMEIAGQMVYGAQNIYFAQLADPNTTKFSMDAVRFMVGKYPFMMGGLPGAALAMYHTVPKEKRAEVKGLYFGAGFTSFLTGITEPIEFTFLFLAPMLFVIHVIAAGVSFALCHILNIAVGTTFSDGLIDFSIFGLLQGAGKTNWPLLVLLMVVYFVVYYFLFKTLVIKWDVKVPGRDDSGNTKLFSKKDYLKRKEGNVDQRSADILNGLGGLANVKDVDACATRLRVSLADVSLVNKGLLQSTGSSGVIVKGSGVQVIYGPTVSVIKSNLVEYIDDVNAGIVKHVEAEEVKEVEESKPAKEAATETVSAEKFVSPMEGNLIHISKVKDEVFSQKMLGTGYAVEPTEGTLVAPVAGEVTLVFDTKHAIGIKTESGLEILIHMGLDTVELKGEGFEILCKVGDMVKPGDPLAKMDLDLIKAKSYDPVTMIILTNADKDKDVEVNEGTAKAGEEGRVKF